MAEQPTGLPPLKFPQGVNNRDREYAVPIDALREAVNLDVTRDGGLISRKGLRELLSVNCHSLYTPPHGRFMVLVVDGQLKVLDTTGAFTALVAVSGPVVYADLNDEIYWTDGVTVGRILSNGTEGVWGLSTPPAPLCATAASGGLYAGSYQVAMTAVLTSGLESGAVDTVTVEVAEGGGIQVTTPAASGVQFVLYRTPANGGVAELRRAAVVNPSTTIVLGAATLGKMLESLHVVRPLPGQCLIQHKGRLWCASKNIVWFTEPLSPHWLRPNLGYFQYESTVTLLASVEDGVYVSTANRVYFVQGDDPYKAQQRSISNIGAVQGTMAEIPYDLFLGAKAFPSKQAAWYDKDGFLCVGKPGGIIVRPNYKQFSAGAASAGASTYRVINGLRQIVSALSTKPSPMLATDVDISTVFANGIVLDIAD